VNTDLFTKGFKDMLAGEHAPDRGAAIKPCRLPDGDAQKQQEKRKSRGEKYKKDGRAFLAENKKKEGVQVTPKRPAIQGQFHGVPAASRPATTP